MFFSEDCREEIIVEALFARMVSGIIPGLF